MKLTKLKIKNYRSFGAEEQIIPIEDLTAFVGNNSTGKTAALSALNTIFSANGNDRILQRSDFHVPSDILPEDQERQSLSVEAVFEFETLDDPDNPDPSIPIFFQHLVVSEPGGNPYLRIRLSATWEKTNTVEGSIDSQIQYIICPESIEDSEDCRVKAARRELDKIRVIYIPAVRDPSKQLKNTSGTMLYQVMNSINWSESTLQGVKEKIRELNAVYETESGVSKFGESIGRQWKAYDAETRYSNATLRFNSANIESTIKRAEVVFHPTETGKEYTIDQMSDGLRSLFYISLVDSILDVEQKIKAEIEADPEHTSFNRTPSLLTIVALEEPENHIAPHLLGQLINNLNSIANKGNAQALMTSHSPSIIKRVDPETIRYFRLSDTHISLVRCITLPTKDPEEQYKYVKEAVKAYPELYFAKLVVLGEGDSEELILSKFWEANNGPADLSGISFVPLGGRFVNHFWRLLNDLGIPYLTLLDLDRERDGGGWARIKYTLDQLIKIEVDKEKLLQIEDGALSDEEFEGMVDWPQSETTRMDTWIAGLEDYGVFFSSPLDIDFLMLEHYGDDYKGILTPNEGPRLIVTEDGRKKKVPIQDIEAPPFPYVDEYNKRIKNDIHCALKECGGDGSSYSETQHQLMIWYTYFFLNRGKPSTHFLALTKIAPNRLKDNMPGVLKRLLEAAGQKLGGN